MANSPREDNVSLDLPISNAGERRTNKLDHREQFFPRHELTARGEPVYSSDEENDAVLYSEGHGIGSKFSRSASKPKLSSRFNAARESSVPTGLWEDVENFAIIATLNISRCYSFKNRAAEFVSDESKLTNR